MSRAATRRSTDIIVWGREDREAGGRGRKEEEEEERRTTQWATEEVEDMRRIKGGLVCVRVCVCARPGSSGTFRASEREDVMREGTSARARRRKQTSSDGQQRAFWRRRRRRGRNGTGEDWKEDQ